MNTAIVDLRCPCCRAPVFAPADSDREIIDCTGCAARLVTRQTIEGTVDLKVEPDALVGRATSDRRLVFARGCGRPGDDASGLLDEGAERMGMKTTVIPVRQDFAPGPEYRISAVHWVVAVDAGIAQPRRIIWLRRHETDEMLPWCICRTCVAEEAALARQWQFSRRFRREKRRRRKARRGWA